MRLLVGKTACKLLFLKQRGDMALMINPGAISASVVYRSRVVLVYVVKCPIFKSSYLLSGYDV